MQQVLAQRRMTRGVAVGAVLLGSGHPISVQSMTTTDTRDAAATLAQIAELATAGCDLVRVAVPDAAAAHTLRAIVAALAALDAGVAKLRLNPGNIGSRERVAEVARAAQARRVPIRVGVNAGSLERELLQAVESGSMSAAEAMAESALREARMLEECGVADIVLSVKSSDVLTTKAASTG